MPIVITIAGGRLKREIVEMALEVCGTAGFEFEHSPEEVASCVRLMDVMMTEWPFSTMGYNDDTPSLPEDESGLAEVDVSAVVYQLALRRAPAMGAGMAGAAGMIKSTYQSACSRAAAASMPTALIAPMTPRGSGARRLEPFITETGED